MCLSSAHLTSPPPPGVQRNTRRLFLGKSRFTRGAQGLDEQEA